MERARRHMTFSNVVAMLALFVALGGTGYAALSLPKNSVGSKQIKKNAVTSKHIKAGAVGRNKLAANAVVGTKVRDGSLGNNDIGLNTIDSTRIHDGSLATGDLGDNAVTGAKVGDGSLATADVATNTFLGGAVTTQLTEATADLADGDKTSVDAHCPVGQLAIGGGARGDFNTSEETEVTSSRPIISSANAGAPADDGTFTGWRATVTNKPGGVGAGIRPDVWVICAAAPPAP